MSKEPGTPTGQESDPPYRVYRSGRPGRPEPAERPSAAERPYTLYRSAPRGLRERLRGEPEPGAAGAGPPVGPRRDHGRGGLLRGPFTPWRAVRWLIALVIAWVLLSVVLFFVSAQTNDDSLPAGAKSHLAGAGPILTSANTVLILGLDNRPTSGAGSKEGGLTASQTVEKDANTDSIMLWRIGGGVSRRLSIPRDTLVDVPGCGMQKINAAWSCGGPAETLSVVEHLTGIRAINHLIVVDLANFPRFINDIGGVDVRTGRICSEISGGRADGGFTLDLRAGTHHLNGQQALILARTRENSCDVAYDDLNREAAQQQILNSIKSQLATPHTFFNLPWTAWDAPRVVQTDMGGASLLQLFLAAEIGGSTKPRLLTETESTYDGADVLIPNAANVHRQVRRLISGR